MNVSKVVVPLACMALLSACAQAPVAVQAAAERAPAPLPLVTSSGLVIGTLSYQYVEAGAGDAGPAWVVHLERLDAPAQDFSLVVEVDPASRRGVFTGALPAGVYAFREAASPKGRYAPAVSKEPFEVQAGEVRDAGHYTLRPVGKM
jgi:hypothetical protein